MPLEIEHNIHITEFNSISELSVSQQELIFAAQKAVKNAYAPYSKFNVGAAIRLSDASIVLGNNQENAAYPSGLCAERVALFWASANFPDKTVDTIAVVCESDLAISELPLYPCGSCRQVIIEQELKQNHLITLLLMGNNGKVHLVKSAASLLPFAFFEEALRK